MTRKQLTCLHVGFTRFCRRGVLRSKICHHDAQRISYFVCGSVCGRTGDGLRRCGARGAVRAVADGIRGERPYERASTLNTGTSQPATARPVCCAPWRGTPRATSVPPCRAFALAAAPRRRLRRSAGPRARRSHPAVCRSCRPLAPVGDREGAVRAHRAAACSGDGAARSTLQTRGHRTDRRQCVLLKGECR